MDLRSEEHSFFFPFGRLSPAAVEEEFESGTILIIPYESIETLSCRVWKVRLFAAHAATVVPALSVNCFEGAQTTTLTVNS